MKTISRPILFILTIALESVNKKTLVILLFIFAIALTAFGQVDNLTNMSAEWMRLSVRNAAADAADIVVYNPAGITKMDKGLHINISNQSLFRNPEHTYDLGLGAGVQSHKQSGSDPLLPSVYAAFTKDKWAVFGGAFISGGGATANYPNGSITTDLVGLQALMATGGAYMEAKDQMLKGSSMYMTLTAGGTYAISNKFSMAVAMRYLNCNNTMEAGLTLTSSPVDYPDMPLALNTEDNATGVGAVISMNYSPVNHLNLSMRYETKVKLEFTTTQNKDDMGITTNGEKNRRDLPAMIALGAAYEMGPVKMYADYNYYFQESANWGNSSMVTNEIPWSKMAGNAACYGLGLEYKMNESFSASIGGGMTNYMWNDKNGYYTNPGVFEVGHDDNYNFNAGWSYKISGMFKVNAGYMHTFWNDQTIKALNAQPMDVDVKMNNSLNAVAIGLDMSF